MSGKYLGTDKCIFRGVVQDSIHDVMAPLLAWRCHRQRRHDVVLWTTKKTLKSDYLLKLKAKQKNNQSLHSWRDMGIPSECPWFASSTTRQASSWIANHGHSDGIPLSLRQASSWIANHGHSDGIPLSLPKCSDRFYYSLQPQHNFMDAITQILISLHLVIKTWMSVVIFKIYMAYRVHIFFVCSDITPHVWKWRNQMCQFWLLIIFCTKGYTHFDAKFAFLTPSLHKKQLQHVHVLCTTSTPARVTKSATIQKF